MVNKKIYAIASITIIILFLSFSMVSASWFGDFWNKITGRAVESMSSCTDSDIGINYYAKGYVKDQYTTQFPNGLIPDICETKNIPDNGNTNFVISCSGSNCFVRDYYCVGNDHNSASFHCPNGCEDGACINETSLLGDVYVIYDTTSFNLFKGNKDNSAIANITNKIYNQINSDKYDFIYIFSSDWAGGGAYFLKVSNDGTGNFLRYNAFQFDNSALYGSKGNLKGIVVDKHGFNRNFVHGYTSNDPIWYMNRFFMGTVLHELMHNWVVYFPTVFNDVTSHDYLGNAYNDGHWEKYLGSWDSVGGDTKTKLIEYNGKYFLQVDCTAEPINNDFELYAMGLIPMIEVKDGLIVVNSTIPLETNLNPFSKCNNLVEIPSGYVTNKYSINDFVNVQGGVANNSKKNYNVAFVLLKDENSAINSDEIKTLNWVAKSSSISWFKSTKGKSTMNEILPNDKVSPIISNIQVTNNSNSIKIKWVTNEISNSLVVYTNNLFGYTKIAPSLMVFPPNLSLNHEVIINSSDDLNMGYYGIAGYNFTIISIDENLNIAKTNINPFNETNPKYILTCQKMSNYYKSWHTTPCSSSACGKDKYLSCEKRRLGKTYYREVCQSLKTYNTACSKTATCGSYKEIKRITC